MVRVQSKLLCGTRIRDNLTDPINLVCQIDMDDLELKLERRWAARRAMWEARGTMWEARGTEAMRVRRRIIDQGSPIAKSPFEEVLRATIALQVSPLSYLLIFG